ncbi:MAG: preprotein translocase subunit SecA [Rickettsiales bacterium]|jgi:preprotein translocase subunit SecA|nr:preprotein translocase subunit SecA [Rickettsiales bacterium]
MFGEMARKLFGTANERVVRRYRGKVAQINAKADYYSKLSDKELAAKTEEFKARLKDGETLDGILPDAFAAVREAARRTLGQFHYDVQLIGGMILHEGKITEMKTGEGKTLVATLPVYLNALAGKGVHVITVNDYLAKRDSEWMGQIYKFLGMSVGVIVNELDDDERRAAYACDITYGTNHEFGFDYLRDNMKFRLEGLVQRPFNYAIVDEVDSILIDEARTPLIISGPSNDSSELYQKIDALIPLLKPEHYKVDEKDRNATLTESGMEFVEGLLSERGITAARNLYDISNAQVVHHLDKALLAHKLYRRDVDYLVRDGQVYIIDEFTGRVLDGRRYSDGLHQALEAKERVDVKSESQTLASITYQNYFRLYPKLAGMTGTAITEAAEFEEIYKLKVVEVPTNMPVMRTDYEDEIYLSVSDKVDAIVKLIKEMHAKGQPILVGTVSIEKSESLYERLTKEGLAANVLNAKHHESEAYIIAQAGVPGTITIATNMAGRGTDIQLGGNLEMRLKQETEGVEDAKLLKKKTDEIKADIADKKKIALAAGGLFVVGTERHESRRIDNQLRGRTGRQGDPGASKFFLSMDDDLMRIFGGDRMKGMLERFGLKGGEAITHKWVTRALEKAQMKVEAHNFSIRKNLLKYDDVMREQRNIIYSQRHEIMSKDDVHGHVEDMRLDVVEDIVSRAIPENSLPDEWNLDGLEIECLETLGIRAEPKKWVAENSDISEQTAFERVQELSKKQMEAQEAKYGAEFMRFIEKSVMLQSLDAVWKEHLLMVDYLKKGIGLRAYGQKDPLNEYKREAFIMFEDNIMRMKHKTVRELARAEFTPQGVEELTEESDMGAEGRGAPEAGPETSVERWPNGTAKGVSVDMTINRNAPCPCGSGKKYKHCCGKL